MQSPPRFRLLMVRFFQIKSDQPLAEINNLSTNKKECAMKKLFSFVVIFSVLLLIGCQENSITDPMSSESVNKTSTTDQNSTTGIIPLEGLLVIPGGFQSYYSIDGQINYTHQLVFLDPMPPAPQYYVDLNLSIGANLTDEGHNTFRISSTSADNIYVSNDGINILEKSFSVLGRNDGLVLVCSFLVTTDEVGLNAIWLSFSKDVQINKSSTSGDPIIMPPVRINNFQ